MNEMAFAEAIQFVPNYPPLEKITTYAVLGGIPHYLKQFDDTLPLSENIRKSILISYVLDQGHQGDVHLRAYCVNPYFMLYCLWNHDYNNPASLMMRYAMPAMFVGRESELHTLENLYQKDSFQMVVVYGRRRVGKTTLLSKFIEGKPAIFFTAQEANDKMNLSLFSRVLFDFFHPASTLPPFDNWMDAFAFLAEKAQNERFVLVIDEFPYAVGGNRSLKSILQTTIDHSLKDSRLFLILCGSQISFMENEVLGYKSPLFGRRTAQMSIQGLSFLDAAKMLTRYSPEDIIKIYACIGGTPHYLAQIDQEKSIEDNLLNLYFHSAGYLYDEPAMLLRQELREPAMYNSVISAIAGGASKLNDISTKIGEDRSKTIKYIETLIHMRILHKEYPFGEDPAKSRKGVYMISDPCFRFWYRYVFPERAAIEQGVGHAILQAAWQNMDTYIGKPFEDMCLQYMIRQNVSSHLPFLFTRSGRWWGGNPTTKSQEEIDLVFSSSDKDNILFAECKWRISTDVIAVLDDLKRKSALFPGYKNMYFTIFSKTGFSEKSRVLAQKAGNVTLVSLQDML